MVSRHSARSSRQEGFVPLGGTNSFDMAEENGIQLTPVKSHVSQTGHRKATHGQSTSFDSSPGENDEKGELHQRHAGRRRRFGEGGLSRKSTGEEEINAMGRLYYKIIGFSVITRYLVYVVPVGILLAVPLIVLPLTGHKNDLPVGSAPNPKFGKGPNEPSRFQGPPLFKIFLWIEIMWLSCWVAKVVALMLPPVFMFFVGVVSRGTRKYATVLSNLILPFSFFFWALASFITFQKLFNTTRDQEISWAITMERILGALFVSSAVFLGEKAIVQLIGISYHQRSFDNRIKASKREVHLLGLLYDASRMLFPMYCREFANEDYIINDSIESRLMKNGKGKGKGNGTATPMQLIGQVGRVGDKVTSVFGNLASEITGKQVFNANSAHSIVLEALEKTKSSEALARRIWMSFVVEDNEALYIEDIQEVLGPAYKDEAEEAFDMVDGDENGDISLDEMIRKIVEISKERKAIQEGMKDIGQALNAFDQVLLFVVLLIVVFIFLAFFKSSFITTLATAGTALLSLSFVFAVTTQEFLGSCIFLFVKHPYDVGDRVEISSTQLVVDKISLLYTVMTRIDKNQMVQVPNIQLNNLWIENITRSKAMVETIELNVSYDTSFEDIELLRLEMEKFVRLPENSRDFQPNLSIDVGGVGNLDKLILYVAIKHKSNWHNDAVRASRRSKFMCALTTALRQIPVYAPGGGSETLGGPTNPTYSVSVSDEYAAKSRSDAAKAKDAGRMIPTDPTKTEEEIKQRESQAIQGISHKPPIPEIGGHWDSRDRDRDNASLLSPTEDHLERSRSQDIEHLRQDLIKRASTRGRRKAGEAPANLTLSQSRPSMSLSVRSPHSPQVAPFDEEAETGLGTTPYHSNLSPGGSGPSGYQPYSSGSQVQGTQRSQGGGPPPPQR